MPLPKGTTHTSFGMPCPIVKDADFTQYKLSHDDINNAWHIVGPTIIRAARKTRADQLYKLFAYAYIQGLEHGASSERERKSNV